MSITSNESGWVAPDEAPEPIRAALASFHDRVGTDPRVAAAFIGGSFATGTWDVHSDLDLYLIVDDTEYAEVFADRRLFLDVMGQVVLAEDFDGFGFDLVVFMLADGIEGELGFGRRSGFGHIHGGPFEVLIDRDGVLGGVTFALHSPTVEQRTGSVERTVAWFWHQLSLFATAAARDQTWTAQGCLAQARREALDLVWWLEAPESWPAGFEKLEQQVEVERVTPIATTLVDLDLNDQETAAELLAEFMADKGREACARVDRDYPDLLEATVWRKIREIKQHRSSNQEQ